MLAKNIIVDHFRAIFPIPLPESWVKNIFIPNWRNSYSSAQLPKFVKYTMSAITLSPLLIPLIALKSPLLIPIAIAIAYIAYIAIR